MAGPGSGGHPAAAEGRSPGRSWIARTAGLALAVAILLAGLFAGGGGWLFRRSPGRSIAAFDGVRLRITDEGTGEPVILLHGFAANTDLNWRLPGLVQELASEFRVVGLDLRGHGLSGKPHDPTRYGRSMVEDVIAVMDHLGIARAHVVGYSLGGIIALKLATVHPERLLTVAPLGAGWEDPEEGRFLAAMGSIAEALEQGRSIPPQAGSLAGEWARPGLLHTLAVRVMTGYLNDGRALAAMLRGLEGLTVERERLREIPVPVLCIVGSLDPMKRGADAMRGLVPDLRVFVIEGADHLQALRRPELRARLLAFLRRHRSGIGGNAGRGVASS